MAYYVLVKVPKTVLDDINAKIQTNTATAAERLMYYNAYNLQESEPVVQALVGFV